MVVVDTEHWDAADRIERWREEFGRTVIGAEVVAHGDRPETFGVRMALLGGDRLASLDMQLRSVRKTRDRPWFADGADDFTFMICLCGTVAFETNGVRRMLRRGESALFSHAVPVDLQWSAARLVTLQVPRALLVAINPERLAGTVMSRRDPATALLRTYLLELWRQGSGLCPRAERHLLELLIEGLTGTAPPNPEPAARAAPRLAALRQMIDLRAGEDLRIDQASQLLGISARTLERTLTSAGTSFNDELTAVRLDRIRATLGGPGRISDIAFAAGFNDLSNFNRRFKARFGRTPSEEREALRGMPASRHPFDGGRTSHGTTHGSPVSGR